MREIAASFARSISSELRAYVFSASLIDESVVDELVRGSGVAGMLSKWKGPGVTVYYIKTEVLERECMYSRCSKLPENARKECVRRCVGEGLSKLARSIARSVVEYAEIRSSGSDNLEEK